MNSTEMRRYVEKHCGVANANQLGLDDVIELIIKRAQRFDEIEEILKGYESPDNYDTPEGQVGELLSRVIGLQSAIDFSHELITRGTLINADHLPEAIRQLIDIKCENESQAYELIRATGETSFLNAMWKIEELTKEYEYLSEKTKQQETVLDWLAEITGKTHIGLVSSVQDALTKADKYDEYKEYVRTLETQNDGLTRLLTVANEKVKNLSDSKAEREELASIKYLLEANGLYCSNPKSGVKLLLEMRNDYKEDDRYKKELVEKNVKLARLLDKKEAEVQGYISCITSLSRQIELQAGTSAKSLPEQIYILIEDNKRLKKDLDELGGIVDKVDRGLLRGLKPDNFCGNVEDLIEYAVRELETLRKIRERQACYWVYGKLL